MFFFSFFNTITVIKFLSIIIIIIYFLYKKSDILIVTLLLFQDNTNLKIQSKLINNFMANTVVYFDKILGN